MVPFGVFRSLWRVEFLFQFSIHNMHIYEKNVIVCDGGRVLAVSYYDIETLNRKKLRTTVLDNAFLYLQYNLYRCSNRFI